MENWVNSIYYPELGKGACVLYGAMIKLPMAPSRYYLEVLGATGTASQQYRYRSQTMVWYLVHGAYIYHWVSCSTKIAYNPYYSRYDMRKQRMNDYNKVRKVEV